MNVNLTPQLDEMLRQKVGSGLYTSASEVIQEALRRMDEKHGVRVAKRRRRPPPTPSSRTT